MGDCESRTLVKTVPKKNALEAWRRLHRKYNPQTHGIQSRLLREVTNFGIKHANMRADQVSASIALFEDVISKYEEDYLEDPMDEENRKDCLKQILPKDVER